MNLEKRQAVRHLVLGSPSPSSAVPGGAEGRSCWISVEMVKEEEMIAPAENKAIEVSFSLEELLGGRVEVVTPDALSPQIGPYILRGVENVYIAA